jgi:septal ring factor EnvC (AmiA/AmiB activator)
VLHSFGDRLNPRAERRNGSPSRRGAEAQVTAPISGVVEYARPFRSYGMMLILRTSDGYHVILSGMSRIYVTEGQNVATGEPVGRMPDRSDPPPELNMELRLGDTVMNPADWLPRRG